MVGTDPWLEVLHTDHQRLHPTDGNASDAATQVDSQGGASFVTVSHAHPLFLHLLGLRSEPQRTNWRCLPLSD